MADKGALTPEQFMALPEDEGALTPEQFESLPAEEPQSWADWAKRARQNTAAGLIGARETLPFAKDIAAATKATVGVPGVSAPTGDFREAKKQVERQQEAAATESPLAYGAGEVGAFFVPAGEVGSLASVAGKAEQALASKVAPRIGETAGKIVGAAGAGAGLGAIQGAGEGTDIGERLGSAATTGALGAGIGAALPAAGKLVGKGVSALKESPIMPGSAARKIESARAADIARGREIITPEEVAAAKTRGQEVLPVDIGGTELLGEARRVTNVSPEAEATLMGPLRERYTGQQKRYDNYLREMAGADLDAAGTIEKMREAAQEVNAPAYRAAYEAGAGGVWNPELYSLVNSPAIKNALPEAINKLQNRAILEGLGPVDNPFIKDKSGNFFLREGFKPNLEFWDTVKRSLDDKITALERKGKYDKSRDVKAIRKRLLTNLDNSVDEYKTARSGAAAAFGEDNAFDAGLQFLSKKKALNVSQAKQAFSKMNEAERELFGNGVLHDLSQKIKIPGGSRDVSKMFDSPDMREKLTLALGPERAAEFEAFNRIEDLMARSYQALQSNSTTARQLSRMGVVGQATAHGVKKFLLPAIGTAVHGPIGAAVGFGVEAALSHISNVLGEQQARKIAELLVSKNPADIRTATNIIARNPKAMDKLRNVTKSLSALAAKSAGSPDREERASGGKVSKRNYPAKRLNLMERAALKAQREIALETKPLMEMPDEHIAHALKIAQGVDNG